MLLFLSKSLFFYRAKWFNKNNIFLVNFYLLPRIGYASLS